MQDCDHVVASHGTSLVRAAHWGVFVQQFGSAVHYFNTTRLAVPHPGFVTPHAFCCDCGQRLDRESAVGDVRQSMDSPKSMEAFTHESYVLWLLSPKTA